MELTVLDLNGKTTSKKVDLSDNIFAIEPNDHAIWLDVKRYAAHQRQGTHKTKERSEITGSRRKVKRQKGTGTARAGDIKNPIFRGGGRAFGPRPGKHTVGLNKKLKQLARRSALTYKARDEKIKVLEDFNFDSPKTSGYVELLQNLDLSGKKTLLVLSEPNKNIYLSSRNLRGSKTVSASNLNTYDILDNENLILVESALTKIETLLSI